MWFGVWGGIGLRQSRQALELKDLGQTYFNDSSHFSHAGSEFCYDVPQEDIDVNGVTIFTNYLEGVTPVCTFDSAHQDMAAFNVLYSFSFPADYEVGYGPILTILFLISVAVYFATSSDSGSLVVDFLASNGKMEHHWVQRLFWALTEGAVATALINAGGKDGLAALQAASIICGLPFTVLILYLLQSIWEFCEQGVNEDQELYEFKSAREFKMPVYGGILNIFEFVASLGHIHPDRKAHGIDFPTTKHFSEFAIGLLVPMFSVYKIQSIMNPKASDKSFNILFTVVYTLVHITWIVLFILVDSTRGLRAWGWAAYFTNAMLVTSQKLHFRSSRGVRGNIIGDFLSSLFLWPQVFSQLTIELESEVSQTEVDE